MDECPHRNHGLDIWQQHRRLAALVNLRCALGDDDLLGEHLAEIHD
jgi:hypothetical protein